MRLVLKSLILILFATTYTNAQFLDVVRLDLSSVSSESVRLPLDGVRFFRQGARLKEDEHTMTNLTIDTSSFDDFIEFTAPLKAEATFQATNWNGEQLQSCQQHPKDESLSQCSSIVLSDVSWTNIEYLLNMTTMNIKRGFTFSVQGVDHGGNTIELQQQVHIFTFNDLDDYYLSPELERISNIISFSIVGVIVCACVACAVCGDGDYVKNLETSVTFVMNCLENPCFLCLRDSDSEMDHREYNSRQREDSQQSFNSPEMGVAVAVVATDQNDIHNDDIPIATKDNFSL